MWPYVNLEDLTKSKTLLFFLQSGARSSPDAFAMADQDAAYLGHISKAIVPDFLNQHVMMFTDRKSPKTYGELIAWDDHENAFDWLTSGRGMHPGQGLIILEMQQRVMRFLLDCCREILHDMPAEFLTDDKYSPQEPVVLQTEKLNRFDSLAVMAAEAPYRVPASLDIERLESLIAAKQSAAADHIWSLREDPSYFANALNEAKEHRQEMIKDTNGQVHPLFKVHREEILWSRVIGNLIANAYLQHEVYTELHRQVKELQSLQLRYASDISIEKDLPKEYLDALLKFQHYLDQATKGPMGQLKHDFIGSPPMRAYFVRAPPPDATSTGIIVMQKPTVKFEKAQGDAMWLLRMLWEDSEQLLPAGLTAVVDELERLIQTEPKAKEMISSHIADVLGDLAIAVEGLRQIKIYQPWSQMFEEALVDRKDGIMEEFAERTKQWSAFLGGATQGTQGLQVVRLGDPSERKFYYPADKRRSKENVEHMRAAEQNLDAFWAAVDENVNRNAKYGLEGTALQTLLSKPRALQRTPMWVEPKREPKRQVDVQVLEKPLSELYFELEHRTERTIDRQRKNGPAHNKVKTRGTPTPALSETNDSALGSPNDSSADAQPTFYLDARALKVFRTLFYTPSLDATPGVVAWTDFLHAIVSTGFVPEKLYGSVWQFQPTGLDVGRSIQFHEPHPVAKLPYLQARRFGRRLERAYGWRGDMFELKEKEDAES